MELVRLDMLYEIFDPSRGFITVEALGFIAGTSWITERNLR